jgi:hypothetical protein
MDANFHNQSNDQNVMGFSHPVLEIPDGVPGGLFLQGLCSQQ